MKKFNIISRWMLPVVAASVMVLAGSSCSESSSEEEGPALPSVAIKFDAQLYPLTRTDLNEKFRTSWKAGDAIGVFATTFGSELQSEGNVLNNAKLVYDGSSWTLDNNPQAQWPSDQPLDFYAYYPYNESFTNPLDITFNVQSEQGDADSFAASNLMLARTIGVARGATVCMMFYHALTLVDVVFEPMAAGTNDIEVQLSNVCNSVKVNLAASKLQAESDESSRSDLTMYQYPNTLEEGYEYRVWVPAQTVETGDHLLKFRYSGWREMAGNMLQEKLSLPSGEVVSMKSEFVGYLPLTRITADEFMMGTPENESGHSYMETQHKVILTKDYYIGTYEVTNSQYAQFLNAMDIPDVSGEMSSISAEVEGYGVQNLFQKSPNWNVYYDSTQGKWVPVLDKGNYPISYVTWYGAKAYADWIGGELPTEAQWEYACRAGTTTAWSFGDDYSVITDYAWCDENSKNNGPSEVGQLKPNPWGLYDMHGNLYEWCSDWFDYYYGIENLTTDTVVEDPVGPDSSMYKVMKGGSWFNYWHYLRSGYRNVYFPDACSDWNGFRVVFPVTE
mgnify:CR=1 FL=1